MKNLYINSRLAPTLIAPSGERAIGDWIFSLGEPWLLLTPRRLGRLAARLGLGDGRVCRLLSLVRRHAANPEAFCRRLGVEETYYSPPAEYPPALCPRCDGVHNPHPEDSDMVCDDCLNRERRAERILPGGGRLLDGKRDAAARKRLRRHSPGDFNGDELSPNYKFNLSRRVERDWDGAARKIRMGGSYRRVAAETGCSVGLLHRKVSERSWENN